MDVKTKIENKVEKSGWTSRLRAGLNRTSQNLSQGFNDIFKRPLNQGAIDDLEELLISADLGLSAAARMAHKISKHRFDEVVDQEEVKAALADEIAAVLEPVAIPLEVDPVLKPHVILICGANGSGKTTTIGKLAKIYKDQGNSVLLAAGDTFRAAAVEQLKIWGERASCPVISRDIGSDAAGLAYDAFEQAQRDGVDILLIDTAGRLQNRTELMDELKKIVRVLGKIDPAAPHSCVLVLDATIGQNAHVQVDVFKELVDISGLIVTKLDGSSKGGVLVALAEKFKLPVHAVGVGEQAEDLRPFKATEFACGLMGI